MYVNCTDVHSVHIHLYIHMCTHAKRKAYTCTMYIHACTCVYIVHAGMQKVYAHLKLVCLIIR